jgi:hypothetical protein
MEITYENHKGIMYLLSMEKAEEKGEAVVLRSALA